MYAGEYPHASRPVLAAATTTGMPALTARSMTVSMNMLVSSRSPAKLALMIAGLSPLAMTQFTPCANIHHVPDARPSRFVKLHHLDRVERDALSDTILLATDDGGNMGAMPVLVRSALRIPGVTPCGIGLCGIECRNGTPSEVFVCGANAAVQDIDMHSFTSAVPRVHVIERKIQLVDAVQPPRQRCGLYAGECTSRLGRKTRRRRSSTGVVEVCNSGCRALGHGTATGSGLGSGRQWNFVNVKNFHWHALCCILHVGMLAQQALQVNKRCLDANHRQTLSRWKALEEQLTFGWQLLRNFF
mmetsp:Transcript_36958/g.105065  ORF Transcript_36958/g.105065 Transcript_36958/m.105065 type:complete len:301 (+) Transcript_36958:469-1371(+)